jgi:hypothetical protein
VAKTLATPLDLLSRAPSDGWTSLSTISDGEIALRRHLMLPGEVDLAVGIAGLQAPGELGLLPFGQVLNAVAE